MAHELPTLAAGVRKRQFVHHIVQPALQDLDKIVARNTLAFSGHIEILPKLFLKDTVGESGLLFLSKL